MADALTDFSSATGILKDMFGGFKSSLRKKLPPLYEKLKPSTDMVSGKQFKFSVQVENPQGVGSTLNASQYFPEAEPGEYIELALAPTRLYGTLVFDRMMLLAAGASADGKRAYVNYLENEMKSIKDFMAKEIGRQICGSKSGVISVCGVTAGSLVLQLDAAAKMQNFAKRGHIDIITTATGVAIANGANRIIQAVDVANRTVTLDTAGGVVTTDATMSVTRKGGYNAEMTGLADIVSDSVDIYGITTAAQRRWRAYISANTGAFDIKKVIKAGIAFGPESGGDPTLLVSCPDLQAQYWYQLTGTRTFDMGKSPTPPVKLSQGIYELSVLINGVECKWISDDNIPAGELHALCLEDLGLGHLAEPEFININGEILLPNVYGATGTPTNKAVIEYYPQMICKKRNSHFKMTGITDIAGW